MDCYLANFLPPATKLGQGYVFTGVCDSVHGGGVPDQVHPPRDQVPPWDQVPPQGPGAPPGQVPPTPPDQVHPPWDQVHPPRPGAPRPGTPPDQVHPPGTRYPPGPGTPPPTRYTPQIRYTPPGPGTPPPDQVPPRDQVHPPRTREIRSTRGRYASYWNAFLLEKCIINCENLTRKTRFRSKLLT